MSLPLKNNIKRFYVFWWGDHGLSALFIILILLFFLSPFIETTMTSFFLAIFYIPLLIAGVASASQSRFLRSIAIITAAIVMAFNILHQNFPGRIFTGCWYLSIVTFFFPVDRRTDQSGVSGWAGHPASGKGRHCSLSVDRHYVDIYLSFNYVRGRRRIFISSDHASSSR